jgi:CheY-like chemotaxis protein
MVGGRLVAKILVADDNSNIQKMVVLALKDQGIDVVAVGNGEAAVRKISDLRPDLVLADVFMPVRNGYEVCQYVKADSALSHIPVILLVGAFDPLDEQEAQRVGADGVLKKPFVPPDPLISMVKAALARAGVLHPGGGSDRPPELEPLKARDLLGSHLQTIPAAGSIPVQTAPHEEPVGPLGTESFVEEVPARPEPVKIDTGSQTVAFGSLLETPADAGGEDLGYLPPVHPELATERDWRDPDAEETEEEEEEKPAAPWRHDVTEDYSEAEKPPAGAKDWRAGSFEQIKARRTQIEDWAPEEEKPAAVETAKTVHDVSPSAKEAPGATPVTPAAPSAADSWAAITAASSKEKTAEDTVTSLEEVAHTASSEQASAQPSIASAPEVTSSKPEKKVNGDSWFSVPSNPWDADMQKANRLASAWDTTVITPVPEASGHGSALKIQSEVSKAVIEEAALPASTVEAIREEAAQVAEDATQAGSQTPSGEIHAHTEPRAAETSAANMDELVARVLAKMSPDVLEAVTREILKPVVEAMVKEELKSKKS